MMALPEAETKRMEAFSPTMFFLVLLPPIIFESGYNLHKGNFFQNIGSIMVFAILGTAISALMVGGGIYLLGLADVVYKLDFIQSFAFGSLISAVDPVATLAIFQALDVEPVLNMLVFGESILNDAVAIVLTTTIIESGGPEMADIGVLSQIGSGITRFFGVFFGSAGKIQLKSSHFLHLQCCSYRHPGGHDQRPGLEADRPVYQPQFRVCSDVVLHLHPLCPS